MAAPSFRAAGTSSKSNGGNPTPALPSGTATGDLLVCVCATAFASNDLLSMPAGWTKFANGTRLSLWWKFAGAGESAPTVTNLSGGAALAFLLGFYGTAASNPVDYPGSGFPNNSPDDTTAPRLLASNDFTPSVADEMIVFVASNSVIGSTSPPTLSDWSGTNPTFTERVDDTYITFSTTVAGAATGPSTSTSALGARTVTSSINVTGAHGALFGIKPPEPVQLAGQSDGALTQSSDLVADRGLAGQSDGAMSPTASAILDLALDGQSAGALSVAATLAVDYDFEIKPGPGDVPPLLASIDRHEGHPLQAGPDERDAFAVPLRTEFQTELPGGFGPGTIVLARPERFDPLEASLFAATRMYDEGGRNAHEGRVTGIRVGVNELTLELEGWAKHTEDDETAAEIFADQDLSAWGDISRQRKLDKMDAGQKLTGSSEVTPPDDSTGIPALVLAMDAIQTAASLEVMYDAGLPIGDLYYDLVNKDNPTLNGMSAANWTLRLRLATDDVLSAYDDTGDLLPNPDTGYLSATDDNRKRAFIEWNRDAAGSADGSWAVHGRDLTVYGRHSLPKRGADPGGLYVSDMVRYILERWCPLLELAPDSIEPTSFAVPHAVFKEDTTAKAMIEALVMFGGNAELPLDWGVYDGRTFFMRTPGSYGREWRMRADEGADPEDSGPDAGERITGVKVAYSDGSEKSKTVGPPGTNSDVETAALEVSDPNHPANRMGAPRRKRLDAQITSLPGATLLGQLFLAEQNRKKHRGDVAAKGWQRDAAGNRHPPYMVRAGDTTVPEDDPNLDTAERRIIGTSYDSENREARVSIGADPDRFDVLLAKAGVVVSDLGVS